MLMLTHFTRQNNKMKLKKSLSAVSMAIRNSMELSRQQSPLLEKSTTSGFSIKIANTLEEREAAFHLSYQVYLEKGYVKENGNQWLIQTYDSSAETVIFVVKDRAGVIIGSATLVFKGSVELPIEKTFGKEIKKLNTPENEIGEVSRLVISSKHRNSKEILVLLFNYMFIYGFHVKHINSCIVQVNPRHKTYYKKLLKFEELSEEKLCPSVQNAPAVLLHLPLSTYRSEVLGCNHNKNKKNVSLYSYFIKPEQENLVAYYLKNQVKPISQEEKTYFGFIETTFGKAVCV